MASDSVRELNERKKRNATSHLGYRDRRLLRGRVVGVRLRNRLGRTGAEGKEMTRLFFATLALLLAACAAPQPVESARQTAAGLESTCGWQQTECSPHAAETVALRIYSSGSVGALLVGDDPCETEPSQQLDVPAGAGWASWAKPGEFTIYAEPVE